LYTYIYTYIGKQQCHTCDSELSKQTAVSHICDAWQRTC